MCVDRVVSSSLPCSTVVILLLGSFEITLVYAATVRPALNLLLKTSGHGFCLLSQIFE